jgi:IPTL-CTERM motif
MNRLRVQIATAAFMTCFAVANAGAQIKVASVVSARGGTAWTLDGSNMTESRAKLLNPANFGVGGTVATPITITDTAGASGSINAALLANFNVLFIGYFANGTFTAAELTAIQTWVNGGGSLIATCDDGSFADVCTAFGHTPTTQATSPVVPTVVGSTHPVFAGPFGAAPSIGMQFTQGFFPSANGATVLGQDSSAVPNATVMVQTVGSGRALFLSDVDMIANFTVSAGNAISNNNDRFLANLFAFAGTGAAPPPPPVVNVEVPTLDQAALVLLALLLLTFGWRRLRQR